MIHIYYKNGKTYCRRKIYPDNYCGLINIDEASCIKCLEKFTHRLRKYADGFNAVVRAKQKLLKLTYNREFDKIITEE